MKLNKVYFFIISLFLIFIVYKNQRIRKNGLLLSIEAGGGLGNRVAGIAGTFILSLLSNREFHSI